MINRLELKTNAKNVLKSFYWMSVLAFLIVSAIGTVCGYLYFLAIAALFLIVNPIRIGYTKYRLQCARGDCNIKHLFFAFGSSYLNIVKVTALETAFLFLWSLLLVIPGIVKSYEYMMIDYLLAEDPNIDWSEAFRISKQMMYGYKWQAFVLSLSFIGWAILASVTVVGFVFLRPYIDATNTQLYLCLSARSNPNFGWGWENSNG